MARIIYSGLVTSIRGSIGGTTFQNNAYGFTAKNKANMIRPNSAQQQIRKLIFSSAVKNWSTMSATGRSNWDTFAATFPQFSHHNPSAVLSGFAVFVKWHTALYLGQTDFTFMDDAPTLVPSVMDTPAFTLTLVLGVLTLVPTWVIGDESWNVNYFLSRPFQPAQNFVGTAPKFITRGTSVTNPLVISTKYANIFGALPGVGSEVFLSYQMFEESGGKVLATANVRIIVT
jgi:hypothetical protein